MTEPKTDVKGEEVDDENLHESLDEEENKSSDGYSERSSTNENKEKVSTAEDDNSEEKRSEQIGVIVATAPVSIDREEYLQAHRDLTLDRQQLQIKNNILHRRLAEYYKKRKLEHVLKPLESTEDLEEKYQHKLFGYEELKQKEQREMSEISTIIQAVQVQYTERLADANSNFDELQNLERQTGTGLIYSKKGKPISDKTVERFLTLQRRKSEQCSDLRLRYIRARNDVTELDCVIKALEKVGTGLYVAQYEQLHIDHQNYINKIEEREDELAKNRSKCTEHNQILAHIKEKMHHTDEVIDTTECDLGDAEIDLLEAREELSQVKCRRDRLRWALETERMKAGLLTRKDLLRDFQDAGDELVKLREKKKRLEELIDVRNKQLRDARKLMNFEKTPLNESSTSMSFSKEFF